MPPRGESFHQIADDPKRAWRRIAPYCMHELSSYAHWAAGTGATLDYSSGDSAAVHHPLCGGLPPELGWESLRLFESAVLPQLAG